MVHRRQPTQAWRATSSAVAPFVLVALFVPSARFGLALWSPPEERPALHTDDAYYYLRVARNVAAGHGSTFYGIEASNGYHPLR